LISFPPVFSKDCSGTCVCKLPVGFSFTEHSHLLFDGFRFAV